ncbi:phytanoyl-CoA dioxygenase family protein [Alphaproteobacteria bacterium]|nr:phytanoyl-CoA dioxygenase family protein [Alphaproteobacteria bacterium]
MWFDKQHDLNKNDRIESVVMRDAVKEMQEQGYTVLYNVLDEAECQALKDEFFKFCQDNKEHADQYKMSTGFHSRLTNLHSVSDTALHCAMKPQILKLLDVIFDRKAALNTSLIFEQGSEQDIHRDTPFFWSNPYSGEYVGVWFALEDVYGNAGPLRYVPGGHKIEVDMTTVYEGGDTRDRFLRYVENLKNSIESSGLSEKRLPIPRGDVLIWHPELPHGGSPIDNPKQSRFSMVCHYMPDGAYVVSPEAFLGLGEESKIMEYKDLSGGRRMRDTGYPAFLPNN